MVSTVLAAQWWAVSSLSPPSLLSRVVCLAQAELAPELRAGETPPRVLLLDTEGLASFDQDETYDMKIFSLGVLLSSSFVYNSQGVIDEAPLPRHPLPPPLATWQLTWSERAALALNRAQCDSHS